MRIRKPVQVQDDDKDEERDEDYLVAGRSYTCSLRLQHYFSELLPILKTLNHLDPL